ncbi:MAG TPA: PAS domain S-box protein [Caldimonas sp.]|nr:PAS domain S-box protein [Caldimonas sp.]
MPNPPTSEQSEGLAGLAPDELHRRLVDSADEYAIFVLDAGGYIRSWNRGAQRLKGYAPHEAIGKHFSMFYPPDAIARGWPDEELRRAAADGRIEDEGWRLRQDGTRFWANVVISALRDNDGNLIGYSKVTRDLSERRRQEERLRDSERSLRLLIEGVQDYAIFRLDPTGRISSWNAGAQRLKGYTPQEIIGRHFSVFYTPEAVATGWPDEELRRAARDGRFEDEGWRVRKDGSLFWANVVITAIRDEGKLDGFSKITRDLTERRAHEEALRESEENLRLLVEGVQDHAFFLVDEWGRIRTWNAGCERLLGFPTDAAVGSNIALLYTREDSEAGRPQVDMALARHDGRFQASTWRRRADGSRFWAETTVTAVVGGPERRGFVAIVRDLTERRRVEELEKEGRQLNEFIAMLSHELRNPLTPISHAVRILDRLNERPETMWCAAMIGRQVTHLSRLVDDLLDVSRILNGKVGLHRERLDLNHIVEEATEAMRAEAESAGHALVLSPSPEPLPIDADSTRLVQVFNNLIVNAVKYTPRGGRIDVDLRRDGAVAVARVRDNGVGLSEALLQTAFKPFVQGARGLARESGGLGMGLALVKTIVDLHGGAVMAQSAGTDRGATFTITLPLATASGAEAPAQEASVAHEPASKILIVDDNADAAQGLATLLRLDGYEVLVAHDGAEALAVAERERPALVLLDLGLPGMDGFEVARRLRGIDGLARARLIAITGYGQDADKRRTAAAGFEAHLVKPVDIEQLERMI